MQTVIIEDEAIEFITKNFESFFYDVKSKKFIIHDTFVNVISILVSQTEQICEMNKASAKMIINDRYMTIIDDVSAVIITFGDFVDYIICRLLDHHVTFWDSYSFIDSFEAAATISNNDDSLILTDHLQQQFNGIISLIPLKKLRLIKEQCDRL